VATVQPDKPRVRHNRAEQRVVHPLSVQRRVLGHLSPYKALLGNFVAVAVVAAAVGLERLPDIAVVAAAVAVVEAAEVAAAWRQVDFEIVAALQNVLSCLGVERVAAAVAGTVGPEVVVGLELRTIERRETGDVSDDGLAGPDDAVNGVEVQGRKPP